MNKLGILMDDRYLDHRINLPSPENPGRLEKLLPLLREKQKSGLSIIGGRQATEKDITRVHSSFYLNQIREHARRKDPYSYDKDTYLMERSLQTAELAAGGCLELADKILEGELNHGFALIRPPGHHAEPGRGMGFCILNNCAITAKYLIEHHGIDRIMILDFDVHHGNGTQEVFYDSEKVLFISLHQHNLFPFSGKVTEVGAEAGRGFTINIPVFSQFGDEEYTYLAGKILNTISEQYMPQIILVSAGYDGHVDETISDTLLSTGWYHKVTTMLKQCARDICNDRLLFILEGGYNMEPLQQCIQATITSLMEDKRTRVGVMHSDRAKVLLDDHPLNSFWTL